MLSHLKKNGPTRLGGGTEGKIGRYAIGHTVDPLIVPFSLKKKNGPILSDDSAGRKIKGGRGGCAPFCESGRMRQLNGHGIM